MTTLRNQTISACRHLLSEINRDPATPTCGCFDRRYWAWKLIDFPEATFQRNLAALAWFMDQPEAAGAQPFLSKIIKSGLAYTCKIQHRNGSFDQAYPYEQSYGATAFLLSDLIDAYLAVREDCSTAQRIQIEGMLAKAGIFLYKHAELHSYISNHLAGAALALLKIGNLLERNEYVSKAWQIVHSIICKQSEEGWYVEYGGADPGYQSLCMYYLAQIYLVQPEAELSKSLQASLNFLQYFIHPDGTFSGEYGSRRTEIYYPGGIALLSAEFPLAAAMTKRMLASIENGQTVTLTDIDMGNTGPLLNNYIKALSVKDSPSKIKLPMEWDAFSQVFPQAGMLIHSTPKYYCVVGISNGGVIKAFDKQKSRLVLDDCGWLGKTTGGKLISTQMTDLQRKWQQSSDSVQLTGRFFGIPASIPSPANFILLRLMNLTIMRIGFLNELVKKLLVGLLISNAKPVGMRMERVIEFLPAKIRITDRLTKSTGLKLARLTYGGKFSSIHMASARYFTPSQSQIEGSRELDVKTLNRSGSL